MNKVKVAVAGYGVIGAKNKELYKTKGLKAVFQGGEKMK